MASSADELVTLLRDIEQKSRDEAAGLPQQRDLTRYWEGIVFNVAGSRLVVALDEVSEILNDVPVLTRVPGAKSWIKGVANIRGNLMPIMDLQSFLGGRAIVVGRRTRVLLINDEGLSVGLLVSNVLGMRHFPETGRVKTIRSNEAIQSYVNGGYAQDGEEWPIFSMKKLTADPAFQVAAK
jgi:twitching motility protein PilI